MGTMIRKWLDSEAKVGRSRMPPLDPRAALAAALLLLFLVLPGAMLADRLLWLHTGNRVLGSLNLDHVPGLEGVCPGSRWAEVKEGRSEGLFAYRCQDAAWWRPFPPRGQSAELRRRWLELTGSPPAA